MCLCLSSNVSLCVYVTKTCNAWMCVSSSVSFSMFVTISSTDRNDKFWLVEKQRPKSIIQDTVLRHNAVVCLAEQRRMYVSINMSLLLTSDMYMCACVSCNVCLCVYVTDVQCMDVCKQLCVFLYVRDYF